MPVPPFQDHLLPALTALGDGDTWTGGKLAERLADHFKLTAAERAEMLPSGVRTRCLDRAMWSLTYLLSAGLLDRPDRGRYQISQAGRDLLANPPARISKAFLAEHYPGFRQLMRGDDSQPTKTDPVQLNSSNSQDADTPTSRLGAAVEEIEAALAAEILDRVSKLSPQAFERLVLGVLSGMGYASDSTSIHHTGQTGDEGIDGIVSQDHLGLDRIYVQAKNWENPVSGPEMNKFIGALDQKRGTKGVYFTRSCFTPQAKQFATNGTKQIVMIDGLRLAQLMIRFGVGVSTVREVRVCRVDQDYFDEL